MQNLSFRFYFGVDGCCHFLLSFFSAIFFLIARDFNFVQRLKAQECDLEVDAVVILSNITVKEYVVLNIRQNTERK